jgi:hypothetical protein
MRYCIGLSKSYEWYRLSGWADRPGRKLVLRSTRSSLTMYRKCRRFLVPKKCGRLEARNVKADLAEHVEEVTAYTLIFL